MKETNMEHFRGEIEKVKYNLAIKDGEIVKCEVASCNDCDFFTNKNGMPTAVCTDRKIKWLMSEYKPEPVLTQREKGFVECISDGWLVRNKDNELVWHDDQPEKSVHGYYWISDVECNVTVVCEEYFPFITWEDEEPWAVSRLRELKVKDYE